MTALSSRLVILLAVSSVLCWGCADADAPGPTPVDVATDSGTATHDASGGADGSSPDTTTPPAPDTAPADTGPTSKPSPLKAYSGGACPTFTSGVNTFTSGGQQRKMTLYLPNETKGASVAFLYHGFGDSMSNFAGALQAQKMSAELQMIVVVPEPVIPVPLMGINSWGFHSFADPAADLALFDDTLACLESNFDINEMVVYAMGFSAGALWTSLLIIERSDYLTAAVVWSGGTEASSSGVVTIPYKTPTHKLPVLAGHGGASDSWGGGPILVKFNVGMEDLAAKLTADGHPVVVCDHGMGHTIPMGGVEWSWHFLRTHYWSEGESQWIGHVGDPVPSYCVCPAAP